MTLPAAVLWDMDGTIIDTEPYWIDAEIALARRDGGTWTHDDGLTLIGKALPESAEILRERAGVKGSNDDIVDDLVRQVGHLLRTHGAEWQPGARELLAELNAAQVPCALVTMSYTSLADILVELLPPNTFTAVVTGDMVTHGKPHPEPYLKAAELLGVDPAQCIAIEDSPTGVASAEAAGARVIGVPHFVSIDATATRSRVSSLTKLTLDIIARIHSGDTVDLV
jgi:HAD superfamily hydrolase (TIGR01509 family)